MEPEKSLDRVVSQRALLLSSSSPCQFCAIGFLCGICITSLILAALTSFGATLLLPFSTTAVFSTSKSSTLLHIINSTDEENGNCNGLHKDESSIMYFKKTSILRTNEKVSLLYSKWSDELSKSLGQEGRQSMEEPESSTTPDAPHLQNCRLRIELNTRLDTRLFNASFPPWTLWKGMLNDLPLPYEEEPYRTHIISDGTYPPWVIGSDSENYPLTRKVQRDIWLHQHPLNCSDPNIKFLVADWEKLPGFGIGAQLAGMSGLLAIAINEKRILVADYYNRADHEGCKGSSRSSWSCYFFTETSSECRSRAFELMEDKATMGNGTVTTKGNYTSRDIWSGKIPRKWGSPWSNLQPTTEINGSFIVHHRKMDRRWWRAQAVRYLMRFQSEYTCNLMNIARHAAFGLDAAKLVLSASNEDLGEEVKDKRRNEMEKFVWSDHKPWVPGPLLSMHVRMGDKACEMKVVGFEDYMHLAERIRKRFPHLNSIWLSTEMQDVIDKAKSYPNWKFYYTNVTRQRGNITMATYEASLGRETSTNYPMVNFLMASEADFFIGALGSTWCFLIDGMRNTGGKVMSGYLSVNKDRFW